MMTRLLVRAAAPLACTALALFSFTGREGRHNAPGYKAAEVQFTCPVDGNQFTSPVTYSYTDFGTTKDLMQKNGEGKFYEHQVHSCPRCHYSGYKQDFEEELTDYQKQAVRRIVRKHKGKIDQVAENLLAAKIHVALGEYPWAQADLYLYASYLLRDKEFRQEERRQYQARAAELLIERPFDESEQGQRAKAQALYLAAELYRRAGKFDHATQTFGDASEIALKPEGLQTLIDQQYALAEQRNDDNTL